jgi:hypothetical protein
MARALEGVASGSEGTRTGRPGKTTHIEDATGAVGERIDALAETIRERVPRDGGLGTAATAVADRLESLAAYLRDHRVEEIGRDVTGAVRRYPMQALLVALGLGYVLRRRFR